MKKQLAILSLVATALCVAPLQLRAEDPVPPKPPGGDKAPAPAAGKPDRKPEGGPGGGGARMNPEERLKMMTEKLGLSQEQQDKIKAINEKNAPQFKEFMAKGRENLTEADKEKMKEMAKTQFEEVAAVLTPEQKEKMKELRGPGGPGGDRKPGEGRAKPGDAK